MNSRIIFKIAFVPALLISSLVTFAQKNDPVLLTVGGDKVTKSEFLNIYLKNHPHGQAIDREALVEYLDLFVKFRLKVKEAESLGMDTTTEFKNELVGYRKDLAKPYLTDKTTINHLVREAYERSQYDLRASHLLIIVEPDSPPQDTLAAWNKSMELRQRILKGEPFATMAEQYSEDPSARPSRSRSGQTTIPGNNGDLGYFTALDMVYPFESGAYNTPKGQLSMPVRSDYGYHLIYVTDRKPALGKATIAHIHVGIPPGASATDSADAKQRIDNIYSEIMGGLSFEEAAARYSDDKSSATKNGVLPEFGVNRMVPEVIEALALLPDTGMVSRPISTVYGWHIVKLLKRETLGDFAANETQLKAKVSRDSRSGLGRASTVMTVKNEFGFKEYPKALNAFKLLVDSSILISSWIVPEIVSLDKKLFKIGKSVYTQNDFAIYTSQQQRRFHPKNINGFIDLLYEQFVEQSCIDYLDSRLEDRNPEFRLLVKEYRDGILLFNLMDERVWSKAVKDTVGLKAFYEPRASNYMWNERVDALVYHCANEQIANQVRSMLATNDSLQHILDVVNMDNPLNLKVEQGIYEKGDNKTVDKVTWAVGISSNLPENGQVAFVRIINILPPAPRTYREARGLATADYQEYLEKSWIDELRLKYPVVINQKVFDSIK